MSVWHAIWVDPDRLGGFSLVGPAGAGKTTICSLVPPLYDVTRGAVLVGGHDVRDITLDSLSRALAMVPQDPHLFHDTVAANLRYARPEASDDEVAEASRAARIHDLITRLPDGYHTVSVSEATASPAARSSVWPSLGRC